MIDISEARKYGRCISCYGEKNVRTVEIYSDPQQGMALQICAKCIMSFFWKSWEYELKNKDDGGV